MTQPVAGLVARGGATTDQVVATARLVLAGFSLLATWLDATQPTTYPEVTYGILLAYLLYAVTLALATSRRALKPALRGSFHGVDILTFSVIIRLTEGPSSPYFGVFTFACLAATLYWGWRGALATAAILVVLFLLIALSQAFPAGSGDGDVGFIVIRASYLVVVGGMLAYVSRYIQSLEIEVQRLAVAEERARLARDLHDSTLQALTAAALRLKVAADSAPADLRERLAEIRHTLSDQQKYLRSIVTEALEPRTADTPASLAEELRHLLGRIERDWGCAMTLQVEPAAAVLDPSLQQEVNFLIAEAAANAVRHGKAKRIDVALTQYTATLSLRIENDGHPVAGLRGAFDHGQLSDRGLGPSTIRDRVTALNGQLMLSSSDDRVALHIELPL